MNPHGEGLRENRSTNTNQQRTLLRLALALQQQQQHASSNETSSAFSERSGTPSLNPLLQESSISRRMASAGISSITGSNDFTSANSHSTVNSTVEESAQLQRLLLLQAQSRQQQQHQNPSSQRLGEAESDRLHDFPFSSSHSLSSNEQSDVTSQQEQLRRLIMLTSQLNSPIRQDYAVENRFGSSTSINIPPSLSSTSFASNAILRRYLLAKQLQLQQQHANAAVDRSRNIVNSALTAGRNSSTLATEVIARNNLSSLSPDIQRLLWLAEQQDQHQQTSRSHIDSSSVIPSLQDSYPSDLLNLQRSIYQQNRSTGPQSSSFATSLAAISSLQNQRQEPDDLGSIVARRFCNQQFDRQTAMPHAISQSNRTKLTENTSRSAPIESARRPIHDAGSAAPGSLVIPNSQILPLDTINGVPAASAQFSLSHARTRDDASLHPMLGSVATTTPRSGLLMRNDSSRRGIRKRKALDNDDKKPHATESNTPKKVAIADHQNQFSSTLSTSYFPLPSLQSSRNMYPSKLQSFQKLWDDLKDSELQQELFRRRIVQREHFQDFATSRSIKKLFTTRGTK